MSNEKLQELLGNNYIPEQLETIPIDAVIAELADRLLTGTKNFANVPFNSVADWLDYSVQNTEKLREILQPLTDDVDPVLKEELTQHVIEHNLKCTLEDVVFIYKGHIKGTDLPIYIWLEIGNRDAGLIHMIADGSTERPERIGHHRNYLDKFQGLTSFAQLFDIIKALFDAGGRTKNAALYVELSDSLTVGATSVSAGQYKFPIGSNGFVVSFTPCKQ